MDAKNGLISAQITSKSSEKTGHSANIETASTAHLRGSEGRLWRQFWWRGTIQHGLLRAFDEIQRVGFDHKRSAHTLELTHPLDL